MSPGSSGSIRVGALAEGVNSRTHRDPIGSDAIRRAVLATTGVRRVPTVRRSRILATSTTGRRYPDVDVSHALPVSRPRQGFP